MYFPAEIMTDYNTDGPVVLSQFDKRNVRQSLGVATPAVCIRWSSRCP
jgi:hypothetical protein